MNLKIPRRLPWLLAISALIVLADRITRAEDGENGESVERSIEFYRGKLGFEVPLQAPASPGIGRDTQAAIVQGVYKRTLDGNASNPERGQKMGAAVPMMAKLAIETIMPTPVIWSCR